VYLNDALYAEEIYSRRWVSSFGTFEIMCLFTITVWLFKQRLTLFKDHKFFHLF